MLKVITGLTGTYCAANWAALRNNLKLIDSQRILTLNDQLYIKRHLIFNYFGEKNHIFSYLDNKDGMLYNYIAVNPNNLDTLRFRKKVNSFNDEYKIESFGSVDDCKDFVTTGKLDYVNSNGLINIATDNSKIYILHNDKQYTVITNSSEEEFHQRLAKANQLPLSGFILLVFVVLIGCQGFNYLGRE